MAASRQLGQAANLLFGYQPVWDPSGSVPYLFFAPPTASVETFAPVWTPAEYPQWTDTPTITIHETADSLVSAIYRYAVSRMALDRRAWMFRWGRWR